MNKWNALCILKSPSEPLFVLFSQPRMNFASFQSYSLFKYYLPYKDFPNDNMTYTKLIMLTLFSHCIYSKPLL